MPADVLVDTSVWVESTRRPDGETGKTFTALVSDDRAVLAAPVWTELRIGARTPKDIEKLQTYRAELSWIEPNTRTWERAGEMGARLKQSGVTVATIDVLLAQLAIDRGITLFSLDTDFSLIAKHEPVKLYGRPARPSQAGI